MLDTALASLLLSLQTISTEGAHVTVIWNCPFFLVRTALIVRPDDQPAFPSQVFFQAL